MTEEIFSDEDNELLIFIKEVGDGKYVKTNKKLSSCKRVNTQRTQEKRRYHYSVY